MTRVEDLTLKLADEALTDAEARELEILLAAEPEAIAAHVRLLEIEAALCGHRETLDLAGPTLARLRSGLAASVERGVMQRLEAGPPPAWARGKPDRSRRREEADPESRSRLKSASSPRRLHPVWNRPTILALAAAVVLLVGLSVWFFGPTMGQPALAEVKGADVTIERGTESVPAAKGMALQSADVVRVGKNASATIAFGAEPTRLELSAGTELKLTSFTRGKRFVLQDGRIEAAVARQRPFHPMIITTPQAEARVLGTRFTLTVTTNATRLDVTEGKVRFTRTSDGASVKVATDRYAVAAADSELAALPRTGVILREYWTNLPGEGHITFLTAAPGFPEHPSGRDYLDKFEAPSHWGTNYGARLCGYLHPPKTGGYTFWITVGDGATFSLSPDDNPINKQVIAFANATSPHEWTKYQGQQSAPVTLVAGRKYYIEVLQKQGVKREDHLAVAWQGPGREREIIPGEFLSPLKPKTTEKKQ